MIADNIGNIEIYKNISPDVYQGLLFLKNTSPDIAPGEYKVNNKVRAIVSRYETKENFEKGYEAHKRAIDIHYPVEGREKIKWSSVAGLTCFIEYQSEGDVAFYKDPAQLNQVITGNGIFAIFFPGDAHSPQQYVEKPELIKKIVLKVAL